MTIKLRHSETQQVIEEILIGTNGQWLLTKDGYTYDMRYWEIIK